MKTKYTLPVMAATAVMASPIYAHAVPAGTDFDFTFTGTASSGGVNDGDGGGTVSGELFFDTSSGTDVLPTDVVLFSAGNLPISASVLAPLNMGAPIVGGFTFTSGKMSGGHMHITKPLGGSISATLYLAGGELTRNALSHYDYATNNGTFTSNNGGFDGVTYTPLSTPTPTPEPASIALLGAGIAGIASFRRRRARA